MKSDLDILRDMFAARGILYAEEEGRNAFTIETITVEDGHFAIDFTFASNGKLLKIGAWD